jgi:nucleotidyltransferase/DNA polymerase involved in DNA repair
MATILHVDMDAFFASVELLHHPEWRRRPLVVGAGPHERGVVSTCSYEARKFGIHSAMPSRTAYNLCPQAIFVRPHMKLYKETSDRVFEIFGHYSPYVEAVSIDEAFLDISGTIHLFGDAKSLGEALRAEVREMCGVTCSVGIAPNRLLAKIGSEQHKPDGLTMMPFEPGAIAEFLAPKPVGILWGVGRHTADALRPYGLTTCGDIQRLDVQKLEVILGSKAAAESLKAYSFGVSSDEVAWQPEAEKSVSREHTFDTDEESRDAVRKTLLELVVSVGRRFRRSRRWAATAKIKLRDASFATITRQIPFGKPARDDMSFREKALELFDAAWPKDKPYRHGSTAIRLIGFGVANLRQTPDGQGQLTLFKSDDEAAMTKRERLSETLDALRDKGLPLGGAQ